MTDRNKRGLPSERILVLDFGSQYTQLIARRVRQCGVYSTIFPHDIDFDEVQAYAPSGVILSGGPASVTEPLTARVAVDVLQMNIPVLGICYGMQTMVAELGGEVENALVHEYGRTSVNLMTDSALLNLPATIDSRNLSVWMSHGDRVISLPSGFECLAQSDASPYAAIGDVKRNLYGLQFHPEVTHTEHGQIIIERFVRDVCGCSTHWRADSIVDASIRQIRKEVGSERVILALSGGVDSSVCAALLHRAISDQLTCIFVDNGLLRLNEVELVEQTIASKLGIDVIVIDARDQFYAELQGIVEPEQKRKVIGRTFIDVFQQQAQKLGDVKWLAQGTIYPDVIESAGADTKKAKIIKSHHNVGGLPESMQLKLLEPLRKLFKDEVRAVGRELGLSRDIIERHPFPGPGLGVRILGEVREEFAQMLRLADAIFIEELVNHDLYYEASQAFSVFLPVRSVGVVGDNRRYDYVISLRAVQTDDFMTARCMRIPYEVLEKVATRIVNEVSGISRVTYDISSKPPATIEWE